MCCFDAYSSNRNMFTLPLLAWTFYVKIVHDKKEIQEHALTNEMKASRSTNVIYDTILVQQHQNNSWLHSCNLVAVVSIASVSHLSTFFCSCYLCLHISLYYWCLLWNSFFWILHVSLKFCPTQLPAEIPCIFYINYSKKNFG